MTDRVPAPSAPSPRSSAPIRCCRSLLGSADATLAVALPAQAVLVAALAHFTERSPIVVVTATGVDADRLADDLACLLPRTATTVAGRAGRPSWGRSGGPVAVLPAWETLPFERVSPEVETMGRRLALLWGLRHPVDDPLFAPAAGDRGPDPRPAAEARPDPARRAH